MTQDYPQIKKLYRSFTYGDTRQILLGINEDNTLQVTWKLEDTWANGVCHNIFAPLEECNFDASLITANELIEMLGSTKGLPNGKYLPPHFRNDADWITDQLAKINGSLTPHKAFAALIDYLPMQYIVAAANRYEHPALPNGEIVLVGSRHACNAMYSLRNAFKHIGVDLGVSKPWNQGFINNFSEWVSRQDALDVVLRSGQRFDPKRNGSDKELFSEGIH